MSEFVFYKKRNFNAYINDTFAFFKKYARNYFSNYLAVNGAMIIAITLLCTFTIIFFGKQIENASFEEVMIFILVLATLIALLILLMQAFVFAYAQLAEKEPLRTDFTSKEVFSVAGTMLGRVFLFGVISVFVLFIPYILAVILVSLIPLLGFFGIIFLNALMVLFSNQLMILYVKDGEPYFKSLGKVIEMLKQKFWEKWGATIVMNMIIGMFSTVVMIIPIVIIVFVSISGIKGGDFFSYKTGLIFFVMLLLLCLIICISSNCQTVTQLMIYFGEKENERLDEIDLIGTHNEANV